jgi:hypothetical protein
MWPRRNRPDAIALSADITGENGLDMFLHLIDALGIAFSFMVIARDGSHAGKAPEVDPFVPFGRTIPASREFLALGKERSAKRQDQGRPRPRPKVVSGSKAPVAHRSGCVHRRRERARNGADGLSASTARRRLSCSTFAPVSSTA